MACVVVIDDEPVVAEACAMILRHRGHSVSVAHDGAAGFQLIRELVPDVVVSDVRMPNMDGLQVVSLMRSNPETAHIPVLLMSGHGYVPRKYCEAFLPKPFCVTELVTVVQSLASRSAVLSPA